MTKFPKVFSKPRVGIVHRDKAIHLNDRTLARFKKGSRWIDTIYDCDDRYQFLTPGDVIGVDKTEERDGGRTLIKITNKRQERAKEYLKNKFDPVDGHPIEEQIGRKLDPNDTITIYEFVIIYEWQIEGS